MTPIAATVASGSALCARDRAMPMRLRAYDGSLDLLGRSEVIIVLLLRTVSCKIEQHSAVIHLYKAVYVPSVFGVQNLCAMYRYCGEGHGMIFVGTCLFRAIGDTDTRRRIVDTLPGNCTL